MNKKQTLKDIATVILFGVSLYLVASVADYMFGSWAGWAVLGVWTTCSVITLILAIKQVSSGRSDAQ